MTGKRSIFEDVEEPKSAQSVPTAKTQAVDGRRGIRVWLTILFALVVLMIAVGGLTRLTDSGLSITEWRPVTGAIPPLSAVEWMSEFDKYRAIPEYELQNKGMTLDEFKVIYWWEWGHRQLGRVVGLVWAAGFLYFLIRNQIPRGWTPRLLGLGLLGGAQGAIGWWMVSSGLTGTMLDVASYRLAVHLGLAFIILGLIAWYVSRLSRSEAELLQARRRREVGLSRFATVLLAVAFLQILLGALVAGLDAGRSYIDWPLMGGDFFPSTGLDLAPVWINIFENAGLAQFNHRMLGYVLILAVAAAWIASRRSAVGAVRQTFTWTMLVAIGQLILGIVTVLYAAPWHLGIAHQLLAVPLFVLILRARFVAAYPPEEKIARA